MKRSNTAVPHQIYLIALRAFNLIIPTVFDQLILLKEEFLIAQLFFFLRVSGFNNVLWI